MKGNKKLAAVSLAVLMSVGFNASAATRKGGEYNDSYPTEYLVAERLQPSDPVTPGKWHPNLDKCIAYAEANGLPLIAVWSNGDQCGHCKKWENNALSDVFEAWMAKSGIVYYFGYYADAYSSDATVRQKGGMGGSWGSWCGGSNTKKALPFVRIYWKDSKGHNVDFDTNGDTWDGYNGKGSDDTYAIGGQYMIDYLMNAKDGKLKDYTPTSPYAGGEFGVHTDTTVGLQAEIGVTDTVYVPFTRTDTSSQKKSYTNVLEVTYADTAATVERLNLVWAAGQTSASVAVNVSSHLSGVSAGGQITLKLYDAEGNRLAKRKILYVNPVANSPKNPYWGDERTGDKLGFGEWTMNLDAVKAKVRAFNSKKSAAKSYAMVLVGGSLWCPDCVMADHWLYDYEQDGVNRFREWAKANNVALGVVDIPNYTEAGATSGSCLLTYDVNEVSSNYVTGRGSIEDADESEWMQSGAQYISRHGIKPEDAAAALARNKELVKNDTLNGGYRRPEATRNVYRTGVPIMLLLRDDGKDWSVAGRFDTFSSTAPRSFSENYLSRLSELLAQSDEAEEEANDDWRTTKETVSKRGTVVGRHLSHADRKDVYSIESNAVGQLVNFMVTSDTDTELTLSVISSANEKLALATATGVPAGGQVSVTCNVPSDTCFLEVSAKRGGAADDGSSRFEYSIVSDSVLVATEVTQYETITDGNPILSISTEAGRTYRITNVDESKLGKYFTKAASKGFYVASSTGTASIYLKDSTTEGGKTVYKTEYQVWKTGIIGFDRGVAVTKELDSDFDYTLKVTRTDGVSGTAKATISLDASGALDDGTVFVWNDEGKLFEWADGSNDVKTVTVKIKSNSFADGEQRLTFKLTKVDGESDAGVDEVLGTITLIVRDDDDATVGTLAICGTEPAFSKAMTTVAPAGSTVNVSVSREQGADGDASALLKTTAGKFANGKDTCEIFWSSRSNEVKTVSLVMPDKSEDVGSLQITLTSTSAAKVDNSRKYLYVKTAECSAAFEAESTAVVKPAVRYVPFVAQLFVNPTTLGAGDVAVVKSSGSLAPGLSWEYYGGDNTLYVFGTPTEAGSWTVVYQVTEDGAPGMTASLTVDVAELAEAEDEETEPINAAVAETRTVRDIIILNEESDTTNLVGLLTVTIPQSGRLSASVRLASGGSESFLSTEWDELRPDGTLVATLNDVETLSDTITVSACPDGDIMVTTSLGNHCIVPPVLWSAANPASAWQGYYTVSMPQLSVADINGESTYPLTAGAGYATLRMTESATATGKMAYAGVLPDGRAFSGVGTLTPDPDSWNADRGAYDYALLPLVSDSGDSRFFGVFRVMADSSSLPCRSVFARSAFTWVREGERDELSRTSLLDAFGSGYDGDSDIAEACSQTFEDELEMLKFFVLTEELGNPAGFARGKAMAWDTTYTKVSVWSANGTTKIKIKPYAAEAKAENGLVLSYNRGTGVVGGSARIDFEDGSSVNAMFRGVVMPRWGASCAMCSFGSDLTLRPFISGSVWFTDTYDYPAKNGRSASKAAKRGCSFSVGVNPGE